MATVHGIDVSHFQGKIDWNRVVKAGKAFAFVKASEGIGTVDPMFPPNWQGARSAGVRRGAYHYFHPQRDPERQAQGFIDMLKGDWGELPPVLDFETLGGASAERALCGAQQWMERVEQACGRMPILYTGPTFWSAMLNGSSMFDRYPLWIAHYTLAPQPHLPAAWKNWTFWQHSEKGAVAGISGPVDLDCFNGSLTELEQMSPRIQEKSATAAC